MVRIFIVDDREFPDPDSNMSVKDVRKSMTDFFPELSNAETTGPTERGDDELYEFRRRVGTKGQWALIIPEEEELPTDQHAEPYPGGILPGHYPLNSVVELLRNHAEDPQAVRFIADMMEE